MKKINYVSPDSELIEMVPLFVIANSTGTEDLNEIPGSWDMTY